MTTSPTQPTPNTSDDTLTEGELEYYVQRLKAHMYAVVMNAFAGEVKEGRVTKASLARKIRKDPTQISRIFSGPGNWTIETMATVLRGINAEMEPQIIFDRDRSRRNYQHPHAPTPNVDLAISAPVASKSNKAQELPIQDAKVNTSAAGPAMQLEYVG